MHPFKEALDKKAVIINKTLEEIMSIEKNAVSKKLVEAMKYTLFSGGKRVRPFLTMEVADIIDGDKEAARKVGAAIELIHTYSLIHDDLPVMDDDDYRRGRPSNHKIYGPGMAVLAGDGLLTFAFNVLSKIKLPAVKIVNILQLISDCAGYNGMVGGQALDILNENKDISLEELKIIHRAKTGALFKAAVMAGAFCGRPDKEELEFLNSYAKYLGVTFQIVDDILDVTGDKEKMGKNTGRDSQLNKVTYTSLLGVEGARKQAEINAEKAKESLAIFGEKAIVLRSLMDYIINRQS